MGEISCQDNHYHLVVKTRNVDLWRSMARLQGRISRAHNRRHGYLGRLWQSRYRARVVDTNRSRATTSTNWRHDIGPRGTSPGGSSSVCSPYRGMGSGPARFRRFLTRAETQSPDGSIRGSAENTMTSYSLRGSTYSIQGSLDDDNGAF